MVSEEGAPRRYASERRYPWRVILLLVLVVAALRVAYMMGYRAAGVELPQQYDGRIADRGRVQAQKIEALEAELAIERKRHELDETALELLRSDIARENVGRTQLEEELQFYRALMAPGSVKNGVSLRRPQLVAIDNDRVAFRFIVQQQASKHSQVKGRLEVQVRGMLLGQEVLYPLSELADAIDEPEIDIGFRYFQTFEGEMIIPEGFEPKGLEVTAALSKPKQVVLQKDFPWTLQERFTHVGK